MSRDPMKDYSLKGLGARMDAVEKNQADLIDLQETAVQIRKLYTVAKRYGPWIITLVVSSGVFGETVNAWLVHAVETIPVP